jgi:predicted nucleic acid-binding protein
MTFSQIPPGASVFVDANTLVYHFANEPTFGSFCTQLLKRIEQRQLGGYVSTHVLADVAHRLMTLEAMQKFSWPHAGLATRLRQHRQEIPKLHVYQQAIARISLLGLRIIPISEASLVTATLLSEQHQLLMGDALTVAAMNANGLVALASNDADFDRVTGITRYTPT